MLDETSEPKQLDLSPTLLTSGFIATAGLLLTDNLRTIEAKIEPHSIVVTVSFEFEGMLSHIANGVPQELDLSALVLTLEFVPTL